MNAAELPLGIRTFTLKTGARRYEARVNRYGFTPVSQRCTTLEEALRWKRRMEALIDSGVDPALVQEAKKRQAKVAPPSPAAAPAHPIKPTPACQPEVGQSPTISDAVRAYLEHRARSHKPIPSNRITDYELVAEHLGTMQLRELRHEDLCSYMAMLANLPIKRDAKKIAQGKLALHQATKYKPATVRKVLYALKLSITWMAKSRDVELHPWLFNFEKGLVPDAWSGHRERRLAAGEEDRLYAAGRTRGDFTYTPSDWRNVIGFALETAMRQQEIVKAQWSHISADGLRLVIPARNAKGKISRTVLLSLRAREIIEEQRARAPAQTTRIFHQWPNVQALKESFRRLTDRAGIVDLHFHDLRHEATSRLCLSGKLNQMVIMEMTGHKSLRTFAGYLHLVNGPGAPRLD